MILTYSVHWKHCKQFLLFDWYVGIIISEDTQHMLRTLLIPKHIIHIISGRIPVDYNGFWRGNQTMLDPTVPTDGILICTRMKKPYVKRFIVIFRIHLG